jgi:hypothetical protein
VANPSEACLIVAVEVDRYNLEKVDTYMPYLDNPIVGAYYVLPSVHVFLPG